MKGSIILAAIVLLLGCQEAWAHGFAVYVSTPMTPPAALVWLLPVSFAVLAISILLVFRLLKLARWVESIIIAVGATVVFGAVFYFIGASCARSSTAPPPGLGPPSAVYWRFRTGELGTLFVLWNAIGIGVWVGSIFLVGRLWRPDRRKLGLPAVLAVPAAAYVILLIPFLATGAFAHGWAGGHVMRAGEWQLHDLNRACLLYAAEHDGTLPVADTMDDLLPKIERYLRNPKPWHGNPVQVHPAAWAFEKEPKPFIWNATLSGRQAPELPILDEEKIPVTCPYTGWQPLFDLEEQWF